MLSDIERKQKLRSDLTYSFLDFVCYFFELKTRRKFNIEPPISRESHYIIISRELEDVFDLKENRLLINVPPGYGKSTLLAYWVAWTMAQYPDSNFLYISYAATIAEKHTATILELMQMPEYYNLFEVYIDKNKAAKGNFGTTKGGCVVAFGSAGSITGQDGGLPNLTRFSGAVIIDDAHNADDVNSDTLRKKVIENYRNTISQRTRAENVPIIFIGQRLHEADLAAFLISSQDGYAWRQVILKSIDEAGNALCPQLKSLEWLRNEQKHNEYNFSAQHQQNPLPPGGSLFKEVSFIELDQEPEILSTFLTCDTAETGKSWNDATVFSFWGVYKVKLGAIDTGEYALHWLDCREMRIEPDRLQDELFSFYTSCMSHKVKPTSIAIEKKSTGVTLLACIKKIPGIQPLEIQRTSASSSKTTRFIQMAPFISKRMVTFPRYSKHTKMCVEHMTKITANDTHAHDDIADTVYDAVKSALIDKIFIKAKDNSASNMLAQAGQERQQLLHSLYMSR